MSEWLHDQVVDARRRFVPVAAAAGYDLLPDKIRLDVRAAPHKTGRLPRHSMAIYSFWMDRRACKVGLVSPNNAARFENHHYSPNACGSTLARSIKAQPHRLGLDACPENYRAWMEANLSRADIILPASWGQPVLKLLEVFLHARWRPIYEGRAWSGYLDSLPPPQL